MPPCQCPPDKAVTQSVSYDAWGVPSYSGAMDSRLMWKGLMWEGDAVGLYYMRNRWYDPEAGRFIQEDPIGLAGGVNPYIFAENDPVNGADPTGLSAHNTWWIYGKADAAPAPEPPPINWPLFWATLIEGISDGGGGGLWEGLGGGGGGFTAGPSQATPKKINWPMCRADAGQLAVAAAADALGIGVLESAKGLYALTRTGSAWASAR